MSVSFAILMLYTRPQSASKSTRRRLGSIQESVGPHIAGTIGAELEQAEDLEFFAQLGALLGRYRFTEKLKVLLVHSDSTLGVAGAALSSMGCALACGLTALFFSHSILIAAAAAGAGAFIPHLALCSKRNRRLKAFNTALPNAIDLMARCLLAGHSMGSSIELIAEQSPEPLAFEFVQVFQQQRLGLHFREALLQMGTRVPSRDLQFLITAILVQKETGGDLTHILERAAYVIRERVRIEGEVRTHTAQGRLTGWILSLLPIIMLALINIVSPGYSGILFHDPIGQKLLYAGGTLIVLGGLIIRKIVDIKV